MGHLTKRSTNSNLQVLLTLFSFLMYVDCINPYVAWNKLLEHGTLDLVIISSLLAFMLRMLTLNCSYMWVMIFFYLLVYVDDIMLTRSNPISLDILIQLLSSEFKFRDLGTVHYCLGIEVHPYSYGSHATTRWVCSWHFAPSRYVILQACWYSYFYIKGY
jgi:hypothetical protein